MARPDERAAARRPGGRRTRESRRRIREPAPPRRIPGGFARLRIGVAPAEPTAEMGDLIEHVLTPFSADERAIADQQIARAAEAVEVALRDGIQKAMATFNG